RLMEDPTGIEEVEAKIAEAQKRADLAASDLGASQERREELQRYVQYLQDQQNNLTRDAARKQQDADAADRTVLDLENPYTARNVLQWLLDQGPRVLLVLGLMLRLNRCIALGSRRLVQVMTGSSKRGTLEEGENRAQT